MFDLMADIKNKKKRLDWRKRVRVGKEKKNLQEKPLGSLKRKWQFSHQTTIQYFL